MSANTKCGEEISTLGYFVLNTVFVYGFYGYTFLHNFSLSICLPLFIRTLAFANVGEDMYIFK